MSLDPLIVADIPPYNNYSITCIATVPSDLLPLQLSFTITRLNQSDIIAQSSNLSTIEHCSTATTTARQCTYTATDRVLDMYSQRSRVIVCSVVLFSFGTVGSPTLRLFKLNKEDDTSTLTVNGKYG